MIPGTFAAPGGRISNVRYEIQGDVLHCRYDFRPDLPLNFIQLDLLVSRRKRVPWRVELQRRKRAKYWRISR